jgi:hypothetical protein
MSDREPLFIFATSVRLCGWRRITSRRIRMVCLTSATALLQVLPAAAAASAAAADEPAVAALQTCNVSHVAEIIAANRRLPLPLQAGFP